MVRIRNKIELRALASEALSIESVPGQNPAKLEHHIASRLRSAWRKLGTSSKKIAIAIAQRYVVIQTIQLPPQTHDTEIETALLAQAEKILPYTVEDIAMDYRTDKESPHKITLAICQKQQITRMSKLANSAGLHLVAAEDDTSARLRGEQLRTRRHHQLSMVLGRNMESELWSKHGARYDTACGLTLREGFNLVPWREHELRHKNIHFAIVTAILIAVAQMPVWLHHNHITAKYQSTLSMSQALRAQLLSITEQINEATQMHTRRQTWHKRNLVMTSWAHANEWLNQMLEHLPAVAPKQLHLEQLRLGEPLSVIHGRATHLSDVSKFAAHIAQISSVRKAELAEIRASKDGLGHTFNIHVWTDHNRL